MTYYNNTNNSNNNDIGSGVLLSEELEIFISCRNLPKLDLNSPSDPFVVISQKQGQSNRYIEIVKTEVVTDNQNPEFTKQIKISYKFEEVQIIRLDAYDADSKNLSKLSDHDYIGFCEFVLGDLVTADGQKLAMKLKNKKNLKPLTVKKAPVICVVRAEEISKTNDEVNFQFAATKLPKMDWGWGKIDGYLQIYRQASDGGWMSIAQTEVIKSNYNPVWKPFKISVQRLCNGDYNRQILIKCWDWNHNAAPDYACETTTTLQRLCDTTQQQFQQKKKGKYTSKKCGSLLVKRVDIIQRFGFLDFIMGGMQIQLLVAIDFTGSNGDPRDASSLHYVGAPNFESPYMRALRSVGRVLEPYDSDGQIAAYGFGANLNPRGARNISHCFNLSLDPNRNELPGIEGVLASYMQCIRNVQLAGPTYFNEIVGCAAACASSVPNTPEEQNYVILLIITDGIINDMQKTIDSIVHATALPLSIIIVGVGGANFSSMDRLDADDVPLRASNGRVMQRDIVQFVPFNSFAKQPIGALAKAVLEEVPEQITGFMSMKELKPLAKQKRLQKMNTMANIYDGPSTLVRANTKNNVLYPELQEQHPRIANAMANTGAVQVGNVGNPYYGQQQVPVQYVQAQPQAQYAQIQYVQVQQPQHHGQQPPQYGQLHVQPGGQQPANANNGNVARAHSQYAFNPNAPPSAPTF